MINQAVMILLAVIIGWTVHRLQSRSGRESGETTEAHVHAQADCLRLSSREVYFDGAFADPRSGVAQTVMAANAQDAPRHVDGSIQIAKGVVLQEFGPPDRLRRENDDRPRLDWEEIERRANGSGHL